MYLLCFSFSVLHVLKMLGWCSHVYLYRLEKIRSENSSVWKGQSRLCRLTENIFGCSLIASSRYFDVICTLLFETLTSHTQTTHTDLCPSSLYSRPHVFKPEHVAVRLHCRICLLFQQGGCIWLIVYI